MITFTLQGLASDGADDTFQILKMVIRGHKVGVLSDIISKAVVAYIYHKINIITADRFHDRTLRFTGTETCCLYRDSVGVSLIALECKRIKLFMSALLTPFYQPFIDLLSQIIYN